MLSTVVVETFEIDGRIEIICAAGSDSAAWKAYLAVHNFVGGAGEVLANGASHQHVRYTTETFRAEWKMYVLEEL